MKTYIKSIRKYWNGKKLTEEDYTNLGDLMVIAIAITLLNYLIIF